MLGSLTVAGAFDTNPQVIGETARIDELLAHLDAAQQTEFPVIDTSHRLVGVITIAQLGRVAMDHRDLAPVLVAADLTVPTETVAPSDSLREAIRRMGARGGASLPVTEPGTERLLGLISRAQILALYERAVAGAHAEPAAELRRKHGR